MAKRIIKKPFNLIRGARKKLSEELRCSENVVSKALHWYADTPLQNEIRERAKKYERRF